MKTLVLGGRLFVGRAIVDELLESNHEVSILNRGLTNPTLFADGEIESIVADRNQPLDMLRGRSFDAVIDTSGYFPRQVEEVTSSLADIGHYTFLSSTSVYAQHNEPLADEEAALAALPADAAESNSGLYGAFKAACEATLAERMPERHHNVRAGLIVGPYDNTGRFSYWVHRINRAGRVLAPGPSNQPVQFIDVRDLARWVIHAIDTDVTGSLNATGSPDALSMQQLLEEIVATLGSTAELAWVEEAFLAEAGVMPWDELPLWLPGATFPTHAGFQLRSNHRALELGLELRPVQETVRAIAHLGPDAGADPSNRDFGNPSRKAGLDIEREEELLAAWAEAPAHKPSCDEGPAEVS